MGDLAPIEGISAEDVRKLWRNEIDTKAVERAHTFHTEASRAYHDLSSFSRFRIDVLRRWHPLGHEQREGWLGSLPFYLFRCIACDVITKSYPQGFDCRLTCASCGKKNGIVVRRKAWTDLTAWYHRLRYSAEDPQEF